jgi:hypothetical protein
MRKTLIAAAVAILFVNHAGAQTAAISDDVVKIGVLTDMSGQFLHESGEGSVTAVKMAVEDFGGKVLGKPIEVVVADHQNKPDIASALARKWFDVDKVDMVANLINSSIAPSVSQLAKEKHRIAIINGSGASRLDTRAVVDNARADATIRTTPWPSEKRARSSAAQSTRLRIWGADVRIVPGALSAALALRIWTSVSIGAPKIPGLAGPLPPPYHIPMSRAAHTISYANLRFA